MVLSLNSPEARDIAYHIHAQTNLRLHEEVGPSIIVKGAGPYVVDSEGRKLLDAMSGMWCTALGYSDRALIDAGKAQLDNLPFFQTFAHKSHPPVIDLAEALIERLPAHLSRVCFSSSGSEAVESAIKFAWYYHHGKGEPDRRKIISRQRAYHGSTIVAGSLTGLPHMHKSFNLPVDFVVHADCPHFYRNALEGESENQFAQRMAAQLEALIVEEGPETIAAFIAEPVMGTGGVVVPPRGYFEAVQPILRKYGILLIADEVICGFGRTGNYWGSQTFELNPDMITCAKGLTSAYAPLSAVAVSEDIYIAMREECDRIGLFGHGFTYGGHPLGAAIACAALRRYDEIDAPARAALLGGQMLTGLRALADHPLVGEVRGIGFMAGLEVVRDRETKAAFDPALKIGTRIQDAVLDRGVIVRALGDTIVFAPPYVCTEADVRKIIDAVEAALDDTYRHVEDGSTKTTP